MWSFYVRRVALAVAFVAAALAVWELRNLLLLVFGAILLAIIFDSLSCILSRYTHLNRTVALSVTMLAMFALAAAFAILLGAKLVEEITQLVERTPDLVAAIAEQLKLHDLEGWISTLGEKLLSDGSLLSGISGVPTAVASAVFYALLVVAGGVFFALHPQTYRQGFLKLIPPEEQQSADETISAVASALRHWLLGQAVSMLCIGILSMAGLYLLGVPSAIALGVLAGILEFVPYIGPVLSTIPAVAIGLAESPITAVWVLVLYVAIQQAEASVITPLIQERAVKVPPGLTIFAILAFGIVLGPLGMALGAPLMVVAVVLIQKLWVRETLGEDTDLAGK